MFELFYSLFILSLCAIVVLGSFVLLPKAFGDAEDRPHNEAVTDAIVNAVGALVIFTVMLFVVWLGLAGLDMIGTFACAQTWLTC